MNISPKERFLDICHFKRLGDLCMLSDYFNNPFWPSTLEKWVKQGAPKKIVSPRFRREYFQFQRIRWLTGTQYGVFCPLFRLHGFREPQTPASGPLTERTGAPNEVWSFGDEAYEIIREILFFRERLIPYILQQMHLAHEKGIPPMRPLFFDFPEDEACASVDDEFLLGPDILVAPVLDYEARRRDVYLPVGISWTDAWTDRRINGGQWIRAEAPLNRIPLYLRGDSCLPIRSE